MSGIQQAALAFAPAGGSTVTLTNTSSVVLANTIPAVITNAVVGSGANRLTIVDCITGEGSNSRAVASVVSATDGAFTHLVGSDGDDANFCHTEMWYFKNPTTGTHTITVTWVDGISITKMGACARNYTGVDQTTPFTSNGKVDGTSGSSTPSTTSQTVGTGELLTACMASDAEGTMSVTAGTERWESDNIEGDVAAGGADRATTGAITWSTATSQLYAISWGVINAA